MLRDQFGQQVKRFREERGLTQEQLAEMSGISDRNIRNIESASIATSIDAIEKLAHALKMHPKDLLDFPWP